MKIVAVLGSPRPQGNSASLARQFLAAARENGAEVREYPINKMNFQGCQGCRTCKTKTEACILEDDLTPVLAAIKEADLLLLASPVYYGDVSGQMKLFFDRTYSHLNPDFSSRVPAGKQAVVVLVQANPDAAQFADIFGRYERWLTVYGFAPVHLLRAVGARDLGDIEKQPDVLNHAAAMGRELAGS